MTEITAQSENAARLIDHLVTAARDAQLVLGTSQFAARQMALRAAAQRSAVRIVGYVGGTHNRAY